MKRWYLCAVLVLVASISQAASDEGAEPRDIAVEDSDFGRLAIAGRSGTLGLGGELVLNIFPQVNGRFGATFFNLDLEGEFSDVEYDFDLDLLTFPISVDWYPFKNAFHVTGGVIINETDVDLNTRSDASLSFGGVTYSASQLGMVSGDVEFNPVVPYIGIGWGNAFGKEKRWGILTDLGVAFIGSPEVTLSASGPVSTDPTFLANLAREEQDIEDDLADFKIYPVLSISLFFRF